MWQAENIRFLNGVCRHEQYEKGIAMGYVGAFFTINLISLSEYRQFSDRILAE